MKPPPFLAALALLPAAAALAQPQPQPQPQPSMIPPGYSVETIKPPIDVHFGVAGLDVAANGDVFCGTRFGEVWRYRHGVWQQFADGLHEVTGLLADKDGAIYVMQKPELTQLIDEDSDGRADVYKTVSSDFGFSGNYHQYAYGPVRDGEGNFYGTLNLGHGAGQSVGGSIMTIDSPYRGTCFKVTTGGELTPFAWGLRSPAGIGMSPEGDLFYTDNQGDWNATSSLHHVKAGRFHGHPCSLAYHPDFEGKDLNKISAEEYAKLRTPPAVWIPHGELACSPGNPEWDTTGGKFGPFAGQIFIGDQTRSNVFRVALEKVGGEYQGCAINMIDSLQSGAIRLAFAPDGSLWVGETSRGWGSAGGAPYGVQRIVFDGKAKPFEVHSVLLEKDGFTVRFTEPANGEAAKPESYRAASWGYLYHGNYGSPKVDERQLDVSKVALSADKKSARLTVGGLEAGRVHRLDFADQIRAAEGDAKLTSRIAYYTANRLR